MRSFGALRLVLVKPLSRIAINQYEFSTAKLRCDPGRARATNGSRITSPSFDKASIIGVMARVFRSGETSCTYIPKAAHPVVFLIAYV